MLAETVGKWPRASCDCDANRPCDTLFISCRCDAVIAILRVLMDPRLCEQCCRVCAVKRRCSLRCEFSVAVALQVVTLLLVIIVSEETVSIFRVEVTMFCEVWPGRRDEVST
jgi:hypothetical protein